MVVLRLNQSRTDVIKTHVYCKVKQLMKNLAGIKMQKQFHTIIIQNSFPFIKKKYI